MLLDQTNPTDLALFECHVVRHLRALPSTPMVEPESPVMKQKSKYMFNIYTIH